MASLLSQMELYDIWLNVFSHTAHKVSDMVGNKTIWHLGEASQGLAVRRQTQPKTYDVTVKNTRPGSAREECVCVRVCISRLCVRKNMRGLRLWCSDNILLRLASHMSKSQMGQRVFFHLAALKVT